MPQPPRSALPPVSSLRAAGSRGLGGGEVTQEPVGGRGRRGRGWRVEGTEAGAWRPLPSGAEKQRRRRASPSPAADPPRRPPSCSLRPPRGHAGASPALRSVACSPCSAASRARRPPALPHVTRRPPPLPSPGPGPLRR
ncbi:wiskott-Aldrich syndrome protein homolog, partial [Cricetulus griseus]|uniref:Wiskott-Aldrich syndrome protein homolog n=1 Tax=Cricetulus griseus TaxID=10029 RepID=A0A9J7GPW6_CRIGR